jgi:glycyl-tRNA synthetase beta chain
VTYRNFLLEIGTEEIPDWMIEPALAHLKQEIEKLVAPLEGRVTLCEASPRRLAVIAENLIEQQADSEELVSGPAKTANPKAVEGFAKKQGTTPEALETVETPKGVYYAFRKKIAGRPAVSILADALPGLILGIPWPKAMYWTGGKSGPRFIRPIRWIVALLGDSIVPFEIAGVKTSNATRGHRKLGAASLTVTIDNYQQKLAANGVILAGAARRQKIKMEVVALLGKKGLRVKQDDALLDTLAYITEYPTAILGSFDPQYLALPAEVLVTVMRHHQKYFSVEDANGKLAPHFVAVMNTNADPEGLVVAGNERVLRARFNDARFFYEVDQKRTLVDRYAQLSHVTFQAQLGSYLDKTQRIVDLVREFGGSQQAVIAARLCKTDLTTEMVKEFTELQGAIGGIYARVQGFSEEVGKAIYEHYKPVSMEDSIPSTEEGQLVSLADKADTLTGCFKIGLIPTGSKDPFALRRAAQGIVKILAEGSLNIPLSKLYGRDEKLKEFYRDRVQHYFREVRGFAYDEVNAAMAAGWSDLRDLATRLEALRAVRPTENFEPLAASFKRIKNILRQADFDESGTVDIQLIEKGPESELLHAFETTRRAIQGQGPREALEQIATLRPAVDAFFDKVLVNAEDAKVRRNRLLLLRSLLTEFSTVADFSEIVTS